MSAEIRVGTASWSDPGFLAHWYPRRLPAGQRLGWYADRFNLVEVNSTFYGVPGRGLVQRWCNETPPGFIFDVKLHQLLSRHSTKPELLPPDLQSGANVRQGKVELTADLERQVALRFLDALEPMRSAGKLGALLLQLSPAFDARHHQLEELDRLLACLQGCQCAIELRNRSWVTAEQLERTLEFFRQRRITLVNVDAPSDPHFTIMPALDLVTTPALAYLRCHGRNARGYLTGKTVAERFNHLYTPAELEEIAERAAATARDAAAVHVIYNNNRDDYAPRNAADFRRLLARKYPQFNTGPPAAAGTQATEMQLPL